MEEKRHPVSGINYPGTFQEFEQKKVESQRVIILPVNAAGR